jgi:hypothetical protein
MSEKTADPDTSKSSYNVNGKKDLSQKLLQGYGLALLQLPFWIVALFELDSEVIEFLNDNLKYYFAGGFGVLGVDLFRKIQSLKNK